MAIPSKIVKEITVDLERLKKLVEIAFNGNETLGSEFGYDSDEYSENSEFIDGFKQQLKELE